MTRGGIRDNSVHSASTANAFPHLPFIAKTSLSRRKATSQVTVTGEEYDSFTAKATNVCLHAGCLLLLRHLQTSQATVTGEEYENISTSSVSLLSAKASNVCLHAGCLLLQRHSL